MSYVNRKHGNRKVITTTIDADLWQYVQDKRFIMSAVLDNAVRTLIQTEAETVDGVQVRLGKMETSMRFLQKTILDKNDAISAKDDIIRMLRKKTGDL